MQNHDNQLYKTYTNKVKSLEIDDVSRKNVIHANIFKKQKN